MPFQTPLTIDKVLDRIQAQEYVLPAIQREFEWNTDQVIRLFDSLMRGYPIGAFLFWKVQPRDGSADDAARDFVFYGFIRDYHELRSPHCPRLDIPRARAVRTLLLKVGLDAKLIEIESHGERDLLRKTPDNTAEPRNRRVEITIR